MTKFQTSKPLIFPLSHESLGGVKKRIKGGDCLLLGLTGGIASGKSTVSLMLKDLGAPLIDFDILARQVVTPGKPAYLNIVDYFGKEVLLPDGTLDRKYLSRVVFDDPGKRKKIEGFTHPEIFEAFFDAVAGITAAHPKSIVQIAVPLLIELDLQSLFHKVVLVVVSEKHQMARLIQRDGISRQQAENILGAQKPMNEKLSFADFVIYNERSVEETRKQVEAVWRNLKKVQQYRMIRR